MAKKVKAKTKKLAKKPVRKAKSARIKKSPRVKALRVAELRQQKIDAALPLSPDGSRKINFKIENIVASANLAVELDLYGIAREVANVEYEPEQFPGAILKLKDPKTSLLLFKNGKLICTGAKSEGDVERSINKAFELIKNCIRA